MFCSSQEDFLQYKLLVELALVEIFRENDIFKLFFAIIVPGHISIFIITMLARYPC